jgi:molybdate transport system substrate-binding protein
VGNRGTKNGDGRERARRARYETDVKIDPGVKIVGIFPEDSHPPIIYPVALTKDAKPDAAQYLAFLHTQTARTAFERYGFSVLAKP